MCTNCNHCNYCNHCGSIIYSEIYHKCIKPIEKNNSITEENKTIDYKFITLDELGILADLNDRNAQDEIVFRYLNQGAVYLSQKNIKPINWPNIIERATNDQYFTYFLLCFEHDEYEHIFNLLFKNVKIAAKMGNSMAQSNLSSMYYRGSKTLKNIKKAIKWATKSAEQNNKYGLIKLSKYYEYGIGVPLDINKAIKLCEQASCQNLSSAQYSLANIYSRKHSLDHALAFKYCQQAANQNHCYAQYCLSQYYKYGRGIPQDYQMAIHWLTLAIEQGLNSAKIKLANMYIKGTGVHQNYNKAFELLNSSIYDDNTNDLDDFIAMSKLAYMYKYGYGVEKDISRSIYLHVKSKKLKNIMKIFKIRTITFINPININYDDINYDDINYDDINCDDINYDDIINIDDFESKIIYKIQSIIIKLKYEYVTIYDTNIENILRKIENTFINFIKLRTQINKSSAMITCLSIKKNTPYKFTNKTQNLYFNEYNLDDMSYLSIGIENVKLSDNIFEILRKYKSNDITQDLKFVLKKKYKEKVNDLINSVKYKNYNRQLNIINDLEHIKFVLSHVKTILSELSLYFNVFIEDIKSNTHIRNQEFQHEYAYIF
ncbi:putative Sel1-like repeat-containing protein [Cotonvirus japonicus]|uniref:Sel1-like repeat-containing protein n=1 Tax=Cotonvirus japonicus TaxID=2811091 RepID=A0ABM7NU77_9VIRU|nr:putative Sel1-like repeat-containing protein [Cotonvirus japonicus]BCS83732.1 putative Sel1-like repeat-containing protein [Cotonvirus japonicus]